MDRDEELSVIEMAIRRIDEKVIDQAGDPWTVPSHWYTDPERAERERKILLRQFPVIIGFGSQLTEPGDYITHTDTGVPIVAVRGEGGELRAFINVCRHRGSPLVRETEGRRLQTFQCPYHGWSYGIDGCLKSIPYAKAYGEIDRSELGLLRIPIAERHGLVFAVATPGATLDIDAFLGDLFTDLDYFGFGDPILYRSHRSERRLNWKLHIDATQEGHHIPVLHAKTPGGMEFHAFGGPHRYAKPHMRFVMPHERLLEFKRRPREEWRLADCSALVYTIFPNSTIYLFGGSAQVTSLFPTGPHSCVFTSGTLRPQGVLRPIDQIRIDSVRKDFWATMEEDHVMCESIQGAAADFDLGSYVFGRLEHGLTEFHRTIDDALEGRYVATGVTLP